MSPVKETKQITNPTGDTAKTPSPPPDDSGITVNQPEPQPEPERVASPDED